MLTRLFRKKVNPSVAPEEPVQSNKTAENVDEQVPEVADSLTSPTVKLGIEKHLFTRTGDSIPVLSVGTGAQFGNLTIKGKVFESNEIVLEESGHPIALVDRHYATFGNVFKIYSSDPAYADETAVDLPRHNERFYPFADVHESDKVGTVTLAGDVDPTFTIHWVESPYSARPRHFPTQHVIKKNGIQVASTQSTPAGHSYILTIDVGTENVEPWLMICLAAIADEIDKYHHR